MSLAAKPIAQLQCFKRTVCIVGATGTREVKEETGAKIIVGKSQPMTLATGIEHFKTMLESMRETIEDDPTTSMDEFPVIQQVLGRYDIFYKQLKPYGFKICENHWIIHKV